MRKYYIYLIEDEVADYFYGRENKFYELFAADRYVLGELKKIVQKQIDFITLPLPHLELHRHLSHFAEQKDLYIKGKVYCTGSGEAEGAEISIGERSLHLNAWGSFESESLFFEMLRKFEGRFLAVDIDNSRYGWIKPIKQRNYV